MKKNFTSSTHLLLLLFLPAILNAQQWYNLNSGTTVTLNSVYFTSAAGYVVGANGTILKTTDAGNTWDSLNSGTIENLLSIFFTDANTGYAAGENATVIKTTDAGANWNALSSGLTAGDHLTSIFFTDANTGYIAGRYGYIIKTTDAGTTWNTQSSGTTNMLEDTYFNSVSGTGYTVGTNATIKYTNNGGSFWQAPSNIATINSLNTVAFSDQYKGFAGGLNGTLVRCTDGGLYWDSITSGTTNNLLDITFLNADTGYIAGGNGTILKTTNSGTSWTALTTGTLKDLYAIFFTNATTGYAVGANGTIIKSCSGLIANAGSDTTICSGTSVTIGGTPAASGGTPTYLFSWSPSNSLSASNTANPVATPGSYTVYSLTVTDINGCTAADSMNMYVASSPTVAITSATNVSCNAGNNGAASAAASGGSSPYSYTWSNGTANANTTGLSAGTYLLTATSVNGCTDTASVTITEPPAIVISISQTNVTCKGGSDGTATANVTGGTTSYTFYWNPGSQPTQTATGLTSGNYVISVNDANGCNTSANAIIAEPPAITNSVSSAMCSGDSMFLQGAYQTSGGTYYDTLSAANSCDSVIVTTLTVNTAPPTPTASGNSPVCAGDTINLSATYFFGATYNWSGPNGFTSASQTSVIPSSTMSDAGTYSVIAFYGSCGSPASTINVTVNLNPTVSFSQNNPACNGSCNGSITSFASSMNTPFNYAWNNGANGSGISALCAGTYSLTVTDNATCTITDSVTLTEPSATIVNAGTDFTFCSNNAAISLSGNVSGATTTGIWSTNGTGTFSPTDTDPNTTYNPGSTDLISGNSVLVLTSTNNGACSAVSDTVVYTFTPAPIVNAGANQIVCADNANVSLNGNVSGGTTTGTWTTNGTGTFTPGNTSLNAIYMSSASDTSSGNIFIVLVSTNNGNCFPEKDTVYITYNPSPVPIIIPSGSTTFCAGGNVDLDAGTGFSSYVWSTTETTQNINVLSGGAYSVTVTDSNNCTGTASQSVTVNSNPTATAYTNNDASCNGANDGSTSVVAGSGTSPYNYLWDNGATTTTINGLAPDTFNVSVTDVNGCFVEAYTIVTEPAALIANAGPDKTICVADSVQLNASGGQIYSWSPSSGLNNSAISNPIASPMNTTNYVVSVQNTNGCFDTDSVTVFVNPFPFINAGSDTIINQGETTTLTATGGNSYLWSTTETNSSISVSPFSTTSYFVNATDSNGCSGADSVTVFVNQIYFSIYGTIYNMAHDTTLNKGTVYLFPYDSLVTLAAVDSFILSDVNGDYAFNNHITNEYIILFRPDNAVYSNSIPTYFGDTTNWDEAQIINLISDTSGIDISTREVPQLSGTGTINGLIQFGIGSGKTGNSDIPLGDPVPGIDVELEQIPGGIVQHTTTNDSGIYSFTNLPLNYTYKLYVDIPGLPMDSTYTVNLTSTDSTVNNLDYVVDTTSDGTAGIYIGYPLETHGFRLPISGFIIYPNPNNGTFTIQIMNDELRMLNFEVKIYNVLGEIVYAQKTLPDNTNKQLTTNLTQGIYNVQIITNGNISNNKIIIQ